VAALALCEEGYEEQICVSFVLHEAKLRVLKPMEPDHRKIEHVRVVEWPYFVLSMAKGGLHVDLF